MDKARERENGSIVQLPRANPLHVICNISRSDIAIIPVYFPPGAAHQSSLQKPKIPFKAHYFPQLLDHFTFQPQSSKIFYQKYLINDRFWRRGRPIFVYTGNEGDIEWFAANTGFMLDIAPKFQALLVFIEHRFYGESMPFGKDSYKSAKTLGYLTSQQALADFAVLLRSLKRNLSTEASPVVVFGGSYGGMLAAWFRLKYPHIAIGALASSAPILQFDDITPWSSFYDAVSKDYRELARTESSIGSKRRVGRTKQNFQNLQGPPIGGLCARLVMAAFVYTAMVNYPTEANFMMPLPAYPVKAMCKIIDGFSPRASKLSRAFAAASLYYNYSKTEKCFNIEHGTDSHGLHGWDWQEKLHKLEKLGLVEQACTEMVMPMTCSNGSMFPPSSFDYKEFAENCRKKYGVAPRPHWITTEFGGS
ncbi:unnamed protein product, partial [Thlaspi arvense]